MKRNAAGWYVLPVTIHATGSKVAGMAVGSGSHVNGEGWGRAEPPLRSYQPRRGGFQTKQDKEEGEVHKKMRLEKNLLTVEWSHSFIINVLSNYARQGNAPKPY